MMPIRIKNFVSLEEKSKLASWIMDNHDKYFFKAANMGGIRKTTRYSIEDAFEYPQEISNIRKRIVDLFDLHKQETLKKYPNFNGGAVASIAFPGDTCYEHIDPIWHDGYQTLHCNVIVQSPDSGGVLLLDGEQYEMQEAELFCYLVSKHKHGTTKVVGDKNRLMFIFGFCVTDAKWADIKQKGLL